MKKWKTISEKNKTKFRETYLRTYGNLVESLKSIGIKTAKEYHEYAFIVKKDKDTELTNEIELLDDRIKFDVQTRALEMVQSDKGEHRKAAVRLMVGLLPKLFRDKYGDSPVDINVKGKLKWISSMPKLISNKTKLKKDNDNAIDEDGE